VNHNPNHRSQEDLVNHHHHHHIRKALSVAALAVGLALPLPAVLAAYSATQGPTVARHGYAPGVMEDVAAERCTAEGGHLVNDTVHHFACEVTR